MTLGIERLFRRDRAILIAGLVVIALLAWAYIVYLSARMAGAEMNSAARMVMPNMQAWQAGDFLFTVIMWTVMMVAMMTPSAAPMVLAFAGVNRKRRADTAPLSTTTFFLLGYLVIWTAFSAAATLLQWGFHAAGLLSAGTMAVLPGLGGALLVAAGAYQFTPMKYVCLSNCRTPVSFLATEWREGVRGALVMGLRHGLYCLGCCWHLMLLLFVAGVMNLAWVALIAGYVLVEKAAPAGQWVARALSLLAIGWGAWRLFQG